MIWPFRREPRAPVLTFAELVAKQPIPPCGDPMKHYHWTLQASMRCPLCAADERRRIESEREDRLAEKIAAAVFKKLSTKEGHEDQ